MGLFWLGGAVCGVLCVCLWGSVCFALDKFSSRRGTKQGEFATPAIFKLTNGSQEAEIYHGTGKKCPKLEEGAEHDKLDENALFTKVKITGTFAINDTTNLKEPVELK